MILEFDDIPELGLRNPYVELEPGNVISNPLVLASTRIYAIRKRRSRYRIYTDYGIRIKSKSGDWLKLDGSQCLEKNSIFKFFIKDSNIFLLEKNKEDYDNMFIQFKASFNAHVNGSIHIGGSLYLYENYIEELCDINYFLNTERLPCQLVEKIESRIVRELIQICKTQQEKDKFIPRLRKIKAMRNMFLSDGGNENEKIVAKSKYINCVRSLVSQITDNKTI